MIMIMNFLTVITSCVFVIISSNATYDYNDLIMILFKMIKFEQET